MGQMGLQEHFDRIPNKPYNPDITVCATTGFLCKARYKLAAPPLIPCNVQDVLHVLCLTAVFHHFT